MDYETIKEAVEIGISITLSLGLFYVLWHYNLMGYPVEVTSI